MNANVGRRVFRVRSLSSNQTDQLRSQAHNSGQRRKPFGLKERRFFFFFFPLLSGSLSENSSRPPPQQQKRTAYKNREESQVQGFYVDLYRGKTPPRKRLQL